MNTNNPIIHAIGLGVIVSAVVAVGASAGSAAAAQPMPNGYYRGNVTTLPIGKPVGYGKAFTRGNVINNTAIGWSFPGKVYRGRSVQDGASVIVVDYRGTAVGFVRDELRPDGRGGYWGRSLNGTAELLRFRLTR